MIRQSLTVWLPTQLSQKQKSPKKQQNRYFHRKGRLLDFFSILGEVPFKSSVKTYDVTFKMSLKCQLCDTQSSFCGAGDGRTAHNHNIVRSEENVQHSEPYKTASVTRGRGYRSHTRRGTGPTQRGLRPPLMFCVSSD